MDDMGTSCLALGRVTQTARDPQDLGHFNQRFVQALGVGLRCCMT